MNQPLISITAKLRSGCILFLATLSFSFAATEEDWREFENEVRKDLRSKTVQVKIDAIKSFSDHDYPKAGKYLVDYTIKERDDVMMSHIAGKVLAEFKTPETQALISKYVTRSPHSSIPLLNAYFANPSSETKAFALKMFNARDAKIPVLTQALSHLSNYTFNEPEVLTKLVNLLKDDSHHALRRNSVKMLGGIGNIQAVPELIPYINDLIIGSPAQDSLYQLTGQQFEADSKAWTAWWEKNKLTAKAAGKSAEDVRNQRWDITAKQEEDYSLYGGGSESFYGEPIIGKSILFVLDCSGSMNELIDADSETSRMDKMKEELGLMIEDINENRNFGFVQFPHDAYPGQGVAKADSSFKKRAKKYVSELEAIGGTPISKAMEYSYQRIIEKRNVDTIYLLSDGEPNKPSEEVRALINGLNSGYYVQINTISIGADSEFLQNVADDHEGNYRAVK